MTWLAVAFGLGVFLLDLMWLHGHGEAALYVIVVLIFLWSAHWRYVFFVAAACSFLAIVGFAFSTARLPPDGYLSNHVISFVVLWLTAIIGFRMNQLSEQLAASEARTRAIVESAAEGIITIDDCGVVESFNAAATRIFGYDAAEIVGQNVKLLLPPERRDSFDRGLTSYLNCGENRYIDATREVHGLRKDGSELPLLIAVSEIFVEQRLFVGIVLDVTELHQAQSRVVQSQRLAAIGEAMTGLAHESRNALQRSQAAAEMLGRTVTDRPDAIELIDRIQDAQDDLHQLYEEVRSYAAPVILRTEPCQLDALMQATWEKMAVVRADRNTQLHQSNPDNLELTYDVDAFAIQRVFRNLLENSLQAAQDPVKISVDYKAAMHGSRPAVELLIRDNGPGLDDAAREKLFVPFFTTKSSGTGLGMSIARRYVDAHGGVIEVAESSTPGTGFRIILPKVQA